ncbi:MAG: hypothetical protein AYK23_04815 [Candidatus Proteinoplasmatales archaeon SG8-5]|nr:MAG: hypothetical protein AYK23_04815 [Candidatus Proteinoplasmatales archaeon SG8-5]
MPEGLKKKIVLLGDSAVGKTSLINRYVLNEYSDDYISTVGTKVSKKDVTLEVDGEDRTVNLMIWDMLGQDGYMLSQASQFEGSHGAMLVADVTRPDTIDRLEKYWIPMLLKVLGTIRIPLIFIANKADLGTRDSLPTCWDMLKDLDGRYNLGMKELLPEEFNTKFLTSAKTGGNVEIAFTALTYMLCNSESAVDPFDDRIKEALMTELGSEDTSRVSVLDQIIYEFYGLYGDQEEAGRIIRQEIARAGLDHKDPLTHKLIPFTEYLTEQLVRNDMEVEEALARQKAWVALIRGMLNTKRPPLAP